jgi:hypothetical protein
MDSKLALYFQLLNFDASKLMHIFILELLFPQHQPHEYIQVAAISGDARRALEICRRAAEIADYQIKKLSSNHNPAPEGT